MAQAWVREKGVVVEVVDLVWVEDEEVSVQEAKVWVGDEEVLVRVAKV